MPVRFAINGFGRVGRCILRAAIERKMTPLLDGLAAINDIDKPKTLAHLFKYDSVHGTFPGEVTYSEKEIVIDGRKIEVSSERDPANLGWRAKKVDIVLECSGRFNDRDGCTKHLTAGARKVLISAPGKSPDITVAYGINHEKYEPSRHHIVSNASCTTNCLTPVAKVIMENFGLVKGLMTTIHSYTNDQRILDLPHEDLRRARAAALSMIPTTTGAAKAVAEVIPELKGKLHGVAIRVPTPNVSLVDLTCMVSKEVTPEEVNGAFRRAAEGTLKGILKYEEVPTVSIDYNGDPHSAVFDATNTIVIDKNLLKVMAWYDNEWGFSNRMVDVLTHIASKGV